MSNIKTYSGNLVDPLHLTQRDINIIDIAQSLSRICRFNGHIKQDWYSVAEHSYHVSYMVQPHLALQGLLHDAAEAYIGDQVSPVKHSDEFAFYRNLEFKIETTIAQVYGLEFPWDPAIKVADRALLDIEKRQVRDSSAILEPVGNICIKCWDPKTSFEKFMQRFNELALAVLSV